MTSPPDAPGLLVEGARLTIGGTPILRDVSLTVARGEFVALLGPSGCGKTSLMRVIAGIQAADAGVVRIGGREVTGLHPAERDIAMVFQSYALYPHLTVAQNIAVPLTMRRLSAWQRVVKQSLNDYPVFGHVMRAVNPVSVTRENAREDFKTVLAKGTEAIRQGRSVLIFPQHTRSPVFDPSLFNSLAVKLARRANAPVVPIAIKTDFMGLGKCVKDFGRIHRSQPVRFCFGEPMPVEGHEKKVHEQCIRFIVDRLRAWGCAVVERSEGGTEHDS